MRTTTYVPLHPTTGSFSQRVWRQFRDRPFLACLTSGTAVVLSGYCAFYEVTFMLSLVPALGLLLCTVNLLDLTTRLYDQDRKWLGHAMALWTLGAAASLVPTIVYLIFSWLFLVG